MKIKPGDVVQLKSGGPKMTVESIDEHFGAKCSWFNGQQLQSEYFKVEALTIVDAKEEDKGRK